MGEDVKNEGMEKKGKSNVQTYACKLKFKINITF